MSQSAVDVGVGADRCVLRILAFVRDEGGRRRRWLESREGLGDLEGSGDGIVHCSADKGMDE